MKKSSNKNNRYKLSTNSKSNKKEVIEKSTSLAQKLLENQDFLESENQVFLWDVEFIKESEDFILRFTLDSENGIDIDICERFSKKIDPLLDEYDFIKDEYILEVSSAGLFRALKNDFHLNHYIDKNIELSFYKAINGKKEIVGILVSFDDENITIIDNESDEKIAFDKNSICAIKSYDDC